MHCKFPPMVTGLPTWNMVAGTIHDVRVLWVAAQGVHFASPEVLYKCPLAVGMMEETRTSKLHVRTFR